MPSRHVANCRSDAKLYTRLVHFHLTWLSAVSLFALAQVPDHSACVQSIEKPSYPQLARSYASEGTVKVRCSVAKDGRIQSARYESDEGLTPEGNKTLTTAVRSIFDRTELDPQCSGDYSLVY